jgi:hypothetical protein
MQDLGLEVAMKIAVCLDVTIPALIKVGGGSSKPSETSVISYQTTQLHIPEENCRIV